MSVRVLLSLLTLTLVSFTSMSWAFAAPPDGVGLQNPSTGEWHLQRTDGRVVTFYFGNPGDYAFMGDWDCDGVDTPGLYRQSDGYVYLRNSNSQGVADIKFFFGNPGDVPLAGDFDGDGCDTVSIYRPANQTFYIINKLGSGDQGLGAAEVSYVFGNPGDKPFVGDFDGDGEDTAGLHRESTGLVYFRNSHTQGNADNQFIFGDPGDKFVAGDWIGDDVDTPGLFRPSNRTFYLRYTNTQGNADEQATWGDSPWLPVAGNFGDPDLAPGTESVEQFLANWETAWQTGNGDWLVSRIHPMVLNVLGAAKCQEALGGFIGTDPTAKSELVAKSGPTLWRFAGYPGVVLYVPNTYTVTTNETTFGIVEQQAGWHLAVVDKQLYWFVDSCDL